MIAIVGATLGMSTKPETTARTLFPRIRPSRAAPMVTNVAKKDLNNKVTRMIAARIPMNSPTGGIRSRQRSTTGPRMLDSTPAADTFSIDASSRFKCSAERSDATFVY